MKINRERRAELGRERRARTRNAILNVAFALTGRERGLETNIDEICKGAGVSRQTFYNYFTSMDDLIGALSHDINQDFNRSLSATLGQMGRAAERVSAAVRYYLTRAHDDPKWAWAMVNISATGPIFGAEAHGYARQTAEEGIASGEFDMTSPEAGCDIQQGATLAGMMTQLRSSPPPDYPQQVARHVLRGLGVPNDEVEEIVGCNLPEPGAPATSA